MPHILGFAGNAKKPLLFGQHVPTCVGAMSGSLKLKIKFNPKPQVSDSAPGKPDHKRKFEDHSSPHPAHRSSAAAANGSHSEAKRSKKQKQQHQPVPPLQSAGTGPKVKLHIKGPWDKAANTSENKDSPLRQSSLGKAFQAQPPSKSSHGKTTLSIKQRPPAKAVQNLGQADSTAPIKTSSKKTKVKGFADGKQYLNAAAGDPQSRSAAVSTASERKDFVAASTADTSTAHLVKSEGHEGTAELSSSTLERIVDKMQRKDNFNIFRDPVTEAVVCFALSLLFPKKVPSHVCYCYKLLMCLCRLLGTLTS